MRRYLLLLSLLVIPPLHATTRYVTQSGGLYTNAGSPNCNGQTTISVATFNGTTLAGDDINWLCGTLASTLSPTGSGTSGHNIIIRFDTGATITVTACGSNGCINLNGLSFYLLDGSPTSTPCGFVNGQDFACNGVITATGNGTGSGSGESLGINLNNASHIEVRDLLISDMYVHTCSGPVSGCTDTITNNFYAVQLNGTTVGDFIHNCVMHDGGAGVKIEAGSSSFEISFNHLYNNNWDVFGSGPSTNTPDSITQGKVHDNDMHDWSNWDTSANTCCHHNGVAFAGNNNLSNGISHIDIYNNHGHGTLSNCSNTCQTAEIFINDTNTVRTFNNVLSHDGGTAPQTLGLIYYWSPSTLQSGSVIVNNTCIGANIANEACLTARGDASITVENNILSVAPGELIVSYTTPSTTYTALDYNMYQAASLSSVWQIFSVNTYATLAAWRTAIVSNGAPAGSENHSLSQTASLSLSSIGAPPSGSPVLGAGVNLSNLGITALNSDALGIARPIGTQPWDIGAIQTSPLPAPSALFARSTP